MRRFNFDISALFGSNSMNSLYGDFASRKSGSYAKLIKSYYSDQKKLENEAKKTKKELSSLNAKKNLEKIQPGLSMMKKEADGLKVAADALEKADLWEQKDGEYDIDKITKAIKSFASEYNDVIDQSANNSAATSQATKYMKGITNAMSKALAKVGVNVDVLGKISVDEEKLKSADVKAVKSIFNGKTSYASQISEKAREISRDTILNSGMYMNNGYFSNTTSSMFNKWI